MSHAFKDPSGLSETRKADHQKMAERLHYVAALAGASVTSGPNEFEPGTRYDVSVKVPGGAYIEIDFDSKSHQPNVFVCTWNIASDSDSCFSDAMGDINRCHFSKATRVCYGIEDLCQTIARDVALLVSGEGYSEERKAAMIAKNGETAAERQARWAKWREEEREKQMGAP